ncbi:MAG: membrane lipoprotein lipid attachment site-containing protein [Bacilli bacterium]|nr:membrane lipoprotein lipid attachment site-containing protein [Bacilli bacterium]
MKKLILFLVLIFTLAGCGVGLPSTSSSFTSSSTSSSSSSSSSSSTTSSSTSSSVVENLVISSKDSLEQVYGEYNRMTFSLNNNSSSVEWYVDGVQSKSFTGNKFEFVPTEVKTYVIFAKIGSNVSNELEVSVKYPNLSVAQVKSIDENTLEIYADGGINFNVAGNEISSSSYYSLSVSKYVIYFKNKLIQGNSYIIHGEKEYYKI